MYTYILIDRTSITTNDISLIQDIQDKQYNKALNTLW